MPPSHFASHLPRLLPCSSRQNLQLIQQKVNSLGKQSCGSAACLRQQGQLLDAARLATLLHTSIQQPCPHCPQVRHRPGLLPKLAAAYYVWSFGLGLYGWLAAFWLCGLAPALLVPALGM